VLKHGAVWLLFTVLLHWYWFHA